MDKRSVIGYILGSVLSIGGFFSFLGSIGYMLGTGLTKSLSLGVVLGLGLPWLIVSIILCVLGLKIVSKLDKVL